MSPSGRTSKLDRLVLFENDGWRRLWPLTATRPVHGLRYGARRLFEKAVERTGAASWEAACLADGTRPAVTRAFVARERPAADRESVNGTVLWWDGAALFPDESPIAGGGRPRRLRSEDGRVLGLFHEARAISRSAALSLLDPASSLPSGWGEETVAARRIDHLWDLLRDLEGEIARDVRAAFADRERARRREGVSILGEEVRVAPDARIDPQCVLDARAGPIAIESGAVLEAFTHLVGPAYVGPGTFLLGGRVTHASLGPVCRVGGEVEAALFQGYANKRHQGFLGHAVVGEWVNLGALTTNSDLKNNYGAVRVWESGREVDSGEPKIGSFLGDHVKTGIGSLLATGAVVGPGSNLFGGGRVTPRFLPGWSWWDGESCRPHEWEKFLATARTAMGRRGVELTAEEEAALREARDQGPAA